MAQMTDTRNMGAVPTAAGERTATISGRVVNALRGKPALTAGLLLLPGTLWMLLFVGTSLVSIVAFSFWTSGFTGLRPEYTLANYQSLLKSGSSFWAITVWTLQVVALLLVGVIIWFLERKNDEFSGGVRKGLSSSMWWATAAMTRRGMVEYNPQTAAGRIVASIWTVTSIVAIAVFAHGSRWFGPAVVAGAIYFVLWAAYALPAIRWPGTRDYSYGLFLYGFPIQQSLVAAFPEITPLALLPTTV